MLLSRFNEAGAEPAVKALCRKVSSSVLEYFLKIFGISRTNSVQVRRLFFCWIFMFIFHTVESVFVIVSLVASPSFYSSVILLFIL